MLGVNARPAVAKVVAPAVRGLARAGVTPDAVTIAGTLVAVLGAVFLIGNGFLFWGAFTVTRGPWAHTPSTPVARPSEHRTRQAAQRVMIVAPRS